MIPEKTGMQRLPKEMTGGKRHEKGLDVRRGIQICMGFCDN